MFASLQRASDSATSFKTIRQFGKNWPQEKYDGFYQLYMTERLPLPEVIKRLEKDHGFIVTEKQCKTKIAEQGLKKNLKRSEIDTLALDLQNKRPAGDGSNAIVHFLGLEVTLKRMDRHFDRRKRAKCEKEKQSIHVEEIVNVPHAQGSSQGLPVGMNSPEKETASISDRQKAKISTPSVPIMKEDLASLLQRLFVSGRPSGSMSATEVPRSDGTIDIQQMMSLNKPQRQELEFLRCEWEKQREIAWHHLSKGRLKDAEQHARITLAAQESCLGTKDLSTMATINVLSYIHGCQTNASEVKTYEWMYEACLEVYGSQDTTTLDAKRDLAWVYQAASQEEQAQSLLSDILENVVHTEPNFGQNHIEQHFVDLSRATTDLAVLLCLQGKIAEFEQLVGPLWSAVAYFTLKHKCSLRVASAMGRKLAGMGYRDDAAFLLTTIVQSAVTETGSSWGSYLNVSSHRVISGRGEVGELLRTYEKHVLPLLAKSFVILRKLMGFGTAACEPILKGGVLVWTADKDEMAILPEELQSFQNGEKLIKR